MLLQWAIEHGCPMGLRTAVGAGKGGHLDVLEWAMDHDCPFDADVVLEAAREGDICTYWNGPTSMAASPGIRHALVRRREGI